MAGKHSQSSREQASSRTNTGGRKYVTGTEKNPRETTKVTCMIEQVTRRKWTWIGHVSRIRDSRWTSRITTWKTYEGKDRRDDEETN